MLNIFPSLLVYGFFAPTILRVAAACVFFYLAWFHWRKHGELSRIKFIVVGRGAWIPILAALFELVIGAGLLAGYYAQIAALLGLLLGLKHAVWSARYPLFFPLPQIANILLVIICFSLLLSGAGALAFDVPL